MLRSIDHFIGGSTFASGERQGDVFDPNQGQVQAQVRLGTAADLQKAVDAAKAAQPGWAATNPQRRARIMFKFKELVEKNMDDLAHLLSSEHGKVIADAAGEIARRLDGLPLALELAAAWVRLFTPATLLAQLGRRLPLLTGGAGDRPARHRALRDTIARSYDRLTPEEQAAIRRPAPSHPRAPPAPPTAPPSGPRPTAIAY